MMSSCPFCFLPGEKVDAHIIPQAFFDDISEDGSVLRQREPGKHSRRTHVGIYDDGVWCLACEKKYGKWDTCAIDVLRTPVERFTAQSSAYELETDKIKELKLFFIALIWRASCSSKRLFNNVSIGSFANLAKNLLASNSPGSVEDFSTIIHCSGEDQRVIAEPVKVRHSGVLFYRFHLGRFTADIKVSSQPTPKQLLSAVIGSKDVLVILRTQRDFGLAAAVSRVAKQLTHNSNGSARKAAQVR